MSELDPKPETCADIEARLPLFVGGDLEPDAQEAVAVHLARCDACRGVAERFDRVRATHQAAMEPLRAEPAPDLWPGVRVRLVDEGVLPGGRVVPGPGSSRFRRVAAAAAAFGAVAAGGLLWVGLAGPFGGGVLQPGVVDDPTSPETALVVESEPTEPEPSTGGGLERVRAGDPLLRESVSLVPFVLLGPDQTPSPNVLTTEYK